jgi:hypothetical protein
LRTVRAECAGDGAQDANRDGGSGAHECAPYGAYLNVKGIAGGTLLQERGLPAKIISGWHRFYSQGNEIVHPNQNLLVFELEIWIRDSGANEWRRNSGTTIQFSYQFGALDCRMRSGYFEIEHIELVQALRRNGADVRYD